MKTAETSEQAPLHEEFKADMMILQTQQPAARADNDDDDDDGVGDSHKEYYAMHQSEKQQSHRDYVDMDLQQAEADGGEEGTAAVCVVHAEEGIVSAVGPACMDVELNEDDHGEDGDKRKNASSPPLHAEECIKAKDEGEQDLPNHGAVIKDTEVYTDGVYLSRDDECNDPEELDGGGDDADSLVLSDRTTCAAAAAAPCVMITEDESHYITTHEIQLCELSDHEGGCGGGADSDTAGEEGVDDDEEGWDIHGNDNVVYSFVDYRAPCAADTTSERVKQRGGVSTLSESDPRDSGSSDTPQRNATGQIHLSIKATSRAINDTSSSSNIRGGENKGSDTHPARGGDAAGTLFIAPPRRLHFATRHFKGKDVSNEYSTTSGTSSAVSELDEADREVRSLTAKAFRSLAACSSHPCRKTLTSSGSSASVQSDGLSRWSAFVDLQYGNMAQHHRGLEHHHHLHQHHQSLQVSHSNNKNKASFEIAQKNLENNNNKGYYKGVALASVKKPNNNNNNILTLQGHVGNPAPPPSSSSSKQIELTGKFTHAGHAGVITLTETLNFRCNVNSTAGGSGGGGAHAAEERRAKFAQQNAGGSRSSTDEVTNTLPGPKRGGGGGGGGGGGQANNMQATPRCNAGSEAMEDTHKKAVFASSVIKNILSKKMQFEQERKMERGEIREAPAHITHIQQQQQQQAACSPFGGGGGGGDSGDTHIRDNKDKMRRQGSKHSEPDVDSSDINTIVCVDELGDIVDSGSCKSNRSEQRLLDTTTSTLPLLPHSAAPETNLESDEAGMDSKKGSSDAAAAASAKSSSTTTLLRSQNSAFRSWRDDDDDTAELELPPDNKINDKSPQGRIPPPHDDTDPPPARPVTDKLTKMSRLFVPTIQLLSDHDGGEAGHQQQSNMNYMNYSTRAYQAGEGGGGAKNSLYVAADSRSVVTSKSPEIKINLRSVRDPFAVSKLRAGAHAPSCAPGGGDFRAGAAGQ